MFVIKKKLEHTEMYRNKHLQADNADISLPLEQFTHAFIHVYTRTEIETDRQTDRQTYRQTVVTDI